VTWAGRKVLVTGASGLLGGALVPALLNRGASVCVLLRDDVPDCRLVQSGDIDRVVRVRGDITRVEEVERALAEREIDVLFHLAAQAIVGTARRSPWQTFESNVRGTWNVLEAARRLSNLSAIVVASSDKAYGPSDDLPYRETHPLAAVGPYDASKAMTDIVAQSYAATYDLPLTIVRAGNLYGPGDLHWNRLIPAMIRARLEGAQPVLRSTGKASRDWLFVEDAADAYVRLAERSGDSGVRGEAFNIAPGEPATVLEVCHAIDAAIGITEPPHRIEGRAEAEGEIPDQSLDSSKAARLLDWTATTSLEAGIAATVGWYRALLTE
jgi:CDP-glucose 4,6-dehydratase